MASMEIPEVDDELRERLGERAAANGRSLEEEARSILVEAVRPNRDPEHPVNVIRSLIEPFGGVDLELPPREPVREPPTFD